MTECDTVGWELCESSETGEQCGEKEEESGDRNRQREPFFSTKLNGFGSSQPSGTHEILFDCCNPSLLLTLGDVWVSVLGAGV